MKAADTQMPEEDNRPEPPLSTGTERLPPSFPTRSSRIVRASAFAGAALVWAGAMLLLWRAHRARALVGDGRELAIFTEAFERNLKMRLHVRALGVELEGEAVRRTSEPYEGRLVVRERWRVRGKAMGSRVVIERDSESRWDRGAGGFRAATEKWRLVVPGLIDKVFRAKATRTRHARTGETVLIRLELPGGETVKTSPTRLPRGVDLSSSFMEAARVRPLYVGARWDTVEVNMLSGELEQAEAEVVEEGIVPFLGLPPVTPQSRRKPARELGTDTPDASADRPAILGGATRVRGPTDVSPVSVPNSGAGSSAAGPKRLRTPAGGPARSPVRWGYRTVVKVEKETGAVVERSETWYDESGRALMQKVRAMGLEFVLERVERLPGSESEWEKMAIEGPGDETAPP